MEPLRRVLTRTNTKTSNITCISLSDELPSAVCGLSSELPQARKYVRLTAFMSTESGNNAYSPEKLLASHQKHSTYDIHYAKKDPEYDSPGECSRIRDKPDLLTRKPKICKYRNKAYSGN